ncbi:enoyl-CoA hydratase/carnithine racemase [Pseudonocardia sediminis]|uniref:Enoyl-CoA hydratase/carnithine racemase n=1 Tax=Pseudonocardia sediminis TaxID=1397368 RepID=A0A4Q7UR06_PSEST|nr:enoyl-CoA hydratase/isomerase family protein [Pseudonocardia sediminis]RZT84247.1 enoyl-CoA hydratase/carnithine racemase [Pseudonocardia sediminis]
MVLITDVDDVRYVTLNRPDKLNALTRSDVDEVATAVHEGAATARVIVFGGAGDRAFSAGMHLDTFAGLVADPDRTPDVIGAVKHMLDTVRQAQVPTICAVRGHCLGAAFELALACDLRIATPGSRFGLPEIDIGLPCIMESALLSQYVGLARAKQIMLTGDVHDAATMSDWGFLNEIVDDVDARATELASSLAGKSRAGLASQKRLFELWQNVGFAEGSAQSIHEIDRVFHDPETHEIVRRVAGGPG